MQLTKCSNIIRYLNTDKNHALFSLLWMSWLLERLFANVCQTSSYLGNEKYSTLSQDLKCWTIKFEKNNLSILLRIPL